MSHVDLSTQNTRVPANTDRGEPGERIEIVTVEAAKARLPELIERVPAGGEIAIASGEAAAAKLLPVEAVRPKRQPGVLKGKLVVPDEVFDPPPGRQAGCVGPARRCAPLSWPEAP